MSAGESAYDVARKQREKAERLQRSAALWEQGADGEVAVARALESLPDGWVVLHDLAWPGRQRANLDHVVIGPGGVFVVDAKHWTGRIAVRDEVLSQNGRRRADAVSSVAAAATAVQQIVSPYSCGAILCFVRDEPLATSSRNVTVCSTTNLVTMLTSRPTVLAPDDVRRCAEAVRAGTATRAARPASSPRPAANARRRSMNLWRPVAAFIGALVLLAAVLSGGYQQAADWAGKRFAEVIVPDVPTEPGPTKPAKQQKKQKQQG